MGRKVGRNLGGARRQARVPIGIGGFVALAAVVLSACFAPAPKPNPPAPPAPSSTTTTTTTTTAPPSAAHLVASPSTLNFDVEVTQFPPTEAKTITITNDGNAPSGVLGLPDLGGLLEPGSGSSASSQWMVGNYGCNTSLAPGASCQFDLQFEASAHQNPAPWTGHLLQTATPGGTADVEVTAQYTSKIEYASPGVELDTTVAAPIASADFVIKNASAGDMTLSSFNLNTIGGMPPTAGTFAFGTDAGSPVQACSTNLVLHAGDRCYWTVTYTNGTGAGTNNAQLQFTVGGISSFALFAGAGAA